MNQTTSYPRWSSSLSLAREQTTGRRQRTRRASAVMDALRHGVASQPPRQEDRVRALLRKYGSRGMGTA